MKHKIFSATVVMMNVLYFSSMNLHGMEDPAQEIYQAFSKNQISPDVTRVINSVTVTYSNNNNEHTVFLPKGHVFVLTNALEKSITMKILRQKTKDNVWENIIKEYAMNSVTRFLPRAAYLKIFPGAENEIWKYEVNLMKMITTTTYENLCALEKDLEKKFK